MEAWLPRSTCSNPSGTWRRAVSSPRGRIRELSDGLPSKGGDFLVRSAVPDQAVAGPADRVELVGDELGPVGIWGYRV